MEVDAWSVKSDEMVRVPGIHANGKTSAIAVASAAMQVVATIAASAVNVLFSVAEA